MAFEKVNPQKPVDQLTPLEVKCTTTRCEDNFHCFKMTQKMIKKYGKTGLCRDCGEDVVDWKRINKNNIKDSGYTVDMMKLELLRNVCWNMPLTNDIIEFARKRGRVKLRERVRKTLLQKVGKAKNFREGQQTPKTGKEIIHYGQHATATCCRKCMEYWHNIPMGNDLTEKQLKYAEDLLMLYIDERIKGLTENGEVK
jgi:hypothetical protein